MHILQIYKDYPPVMGGIEHHLRDLAHGMAARDHRITTLVTSQHGHTSIVYPGPGQTVIRAARAAHLASTPLSPAQLAWARALHPDLIHLQYPYPPGDLAALLVPGAPPLVVSYQSDIVRQRLLRHIYAPLQALTLRRATRIIASSPQYLASSPVLQQHTAKITVVPLGVDTTRFTPDGSVLLPRMSSELRLLFVGRLRYYKGLHILLAALAQLPPHITLWLAGGGPEQPRLAAQVEALGLGPRVQFLTDVGDADLPALYRSADVFVFPSHLRAEAFGIALLEALASGLPCISTELGTGTSYVNAHGVTGIVVPPADSAALAAAIAALASDSARRTAMCAAARQRALAMFTRESMIDAIAAVYHAARP